MKIEDRLNRFIEFFEIEKYQNKIRENAGKDKKRVTIEYADLVGFDSELANDMIEQPEEVLKIAETAVEHFDMLGDVKKFKVRVRGDIPSMGVRLRDLRSKHLDKFVTIEGTIETKTDVSVRVTASKLECNSCGSIMNILQTEDVMKEPVRCVKCGMKGKFTLLDEEKMDCFTMRVQELSSAIKFGSAMVMKSVLCNNDLTDPLIEERLVEGLKVKINGIYFKKEVMKHGTKQTMQVTYIEANYIEISDETFFDIELTQEDVKEIKDFAANHKGNLIKTFAEGLFRGVYGNFKIKEALTLQAFGGVSNYSATPKVRGDIHVLLVGDAGENKSVFLEYVSKFHPKAILAVGKTVSAPGLRGTAIRDELTGSYVLKPGAIMLANNGILCIDEFDKMKPEDRDVLHEPAEQQSCTINIANLADRKVLARESLLVAMNPKNSWFNEWDPIYEQIDLPPTLTSRFDLLYVVKKSKERTPEAKQREKEKGKMMMTRSHPEVQDKLAKFHRFGRRYIAWSKQNIFPKFNKYLEEEYIPEKYASFDHERKKPDEEIGKDEERRKGEFPITPRHLFIIKRLAEARRRMFLDETIIQEDVDYAIDKIGDSLKDIAIDIQTGKIDTEWVRDGVPTSTKKLVEVFDEVYDKLEQGNLCKVDDFYEELEKQGIELLKIEEFMKKKARAGDIFYPKGERSGFFQRNPG